MARIEEELATAKAAKPALDFPSNTLAIDLLRKAKWMAAEQKRTASIVGPLNDARNNLGLSLPPVIRAFKKGKPNQADKDKAKDAIDAWIKELEAAALLKTEPSKPPPSRWKKPLVLMGVIVLWIFIVYTAYLSTRKESLTGAVILILLFCFPVSTWIFYIGREVISKHIVKALDYATLLTFVTGIVAIAEIDTATFQERARNAAAQIPSIRDNLHHTLNRELASCDKWQINVDNVFSGELWRPFLFCFVLGSWHHIDLDTLPPDQVARRALTLRVLSGLLPSDQGHTEALADIQKYNNLLIEMRPTTFIGTLIPKTFAFLLVAFAFAVRLTRTTLEVFEWHLK
jgi:hypothetical protein